jgi:hypothetical protein
MWDYIQTIKVKYRPYKKIFLINVVDINKLYILCHVLTFHTTGCASEN